MSDREMKDGKGQGQEQLERQEPGQRDVGVEVFDPAADQSWDDEGDDQPEFDSGDQDYDSAEGWGVKSSSEKRAEAMKRDPRANGPDPVMFMTMPWNDWMDIALESKPQEYLLGSFWRTDELAVLFAGTGTGKSVLATQIAESLARGIPMEPFAHPDAPKPEPRVVLYLDFELNLNQCAMRYSVIDARNTEYSYRYRFSPQLIRAEPFWNGQIQAGYDGFSDMFFTALTNLVHDTEATVVICDNITFLDRTSTTNADTALNIMRSLLQIKRENPVSTLVLAHTPKRRPWLPLSEIDLQGSINLANFADSIFAIGRSRQSQDLRYLKHIKIRSGRAEYTEEKVPVFELKKFNNAASITQTPDAEFHDNFLGFKFVEFANEDDHLDSGFQLTRDAHRRPKNTSTVIRQVKKLAAEGKGQRSIAAELGIPITTIRRYIESA